MGIRRLVIIAAVGVLAVACGDDDFGIDREAPTPPEECTGSECDEETAEEGDGEEMSGDTEISGVEPPDGAGEHEPRVVPATDPLGDQDEFPEEDGGEDADGSDGDDDSDTSGDGDDGNSGDDGDDGSDDISTPSDGDGDSDSDFVVTDDDLQCADDPAICRFCGPAQGVVEECPDGDDSFACQVFALVNETRAAHGKDTLEYDGTLAESAMVHAMDLNYCDFFAHDSLDGTTFFERCADNGYAGTCTGENIGGGQSTPEDVMEAWMDSPGHRDNILYDNHTEIGIAYYEGDGTYGRYWLKHFGRD